MSKISSQPSSKTRWYRIGTLLFLIYIFAFIDRTNIGMAAPSMTKELGLTPATMGVIMSAFFWGYVLTQVPGGWVAQKFSAKWIIVILSMTFAIFSALTGVMKTVSSLEVVRFLLGLAEGFMWPSFMVLASRWFPMHERAQITGLIFIGVPLSGAVLSPLAGWMIQTWDWQVMFYLQAIPPFILAVLAMFLLSDDPMKDKRLSMDEREYILNNRSNPSTDDHTKKQPFLKSILSIRLWVLAVIYLFWLCGLYAYGLWLPSAVKSLGDLSTTMVGVLSAVPPLLGACAMTLNSRLSDKKMKRGKYVISWVALGGIALLVGNFVHDPILSYMLLCVIAIGVYGPFGVWWAWCLEHVSSEHVGTHNAVINLCGSFGGIIGPPMVALASVGGNVGSGFYILGVAMLVAALLALLLNFSSNKAKAAELSLEKPPAV
ncbi:MFS transporter [Bacillus sp. FJAT-29953]|nr:MFS transporter [Bacillus sp. FJAT-29953]